MPDVKAADAVLLEKNSKRVHELENREAPTGAMIWANCQKIKVNDKGYEMNQAGEARIPIRGGDIDAEVVAGGDFDYSREKIFATHVQASYEIGQDKYMQYSNGDGHVLASVDSEVKKTTEELMRYREVCALGDGSGALCRIKTQAAGSSTTVLQFETTGNGTFAMTFGAFYLKTGIEYDLVDPSDASTPVKSRITFSAINRTSNTGTVGTASVALTNGMITNQTILVMPGTYNNVPKGLRYLYAVDKQGVWQNRDLAGSLTRNTPGVNAGGRKISNTLVRLAMDRADIRNANTPKRKMFFSKAQMSTFEARAEGLFRLGSGDNKLDTGVTQIGYKGFMFEEAKHFDADLVLGCDLGELICVQRMEGVGPIKGPDTGELFRVTYGAAGRPKLTYIMTIGAYDGLGTESPENGIQIYNLSHAGGVTLANYQATDLAGL